MGKVVKKIGGALGFGSSATYKPTYLGKEQFDISQELKPAQEDYAKLLESTRAAQAATAAPRTDVLTQMGQAALGQGPSLAEAQLKQAQDRTLAQQLAAVQAGRGGNAAMQQRGLMQAQSGMGRDLAQQAAIERLRERDSFMQQANIADQGLRTDIQGKLDLDTMNKDRLMKLEMANTQMQNQAAQMKAQQTQQMRGAIFGGLAGGIGKMATGGAFGSGGFGDFLGSFAPVEKAEGGMVKKSDVKKYKDGGSVKSMTDFIEGIRRKKAAGSQANVYQKLEDEKKPEVNEYKERRKREEHERAIRNLKSGGSVKGPGTPTSDSIPAMLSDGEFVVKSKVVSKPGVAAFLEKLNSEKLSEKDASKLAKALAARKKKA